MDQDKLVSCQQDMARTHQALAEAFKKMRTGRAHPGLLDPVMVDYFGTQTPLNQVCSITAQDARTLTLTVWEKSMIGPIEKAIIASGLGLNPIAHGLVLKVPMPPLTAERRQDLIKVARATAEKSRIAVRNSRRDAMNAIKKQKKDKSMTDDQAKSEEAQLQKITDAAIAKIDTMLSDKEADLVAI